MLCLIKDKRRPRAVSIENSPLVVSQSGRNLVLSVVSLWSKGNKGKNADFQHETVRNSSSKNNNKSPAFCRNIAGISANTEQRRGYRDALSFAIWSEWRDLNPRPHGPEPCALPAALHPDSYPIIIFLFRAVKGEFLVVFGDMTSICVRLSNGL